MIFSGTVLAESPIYRGNSRKTLFTRNGNGKEKLVSLAGEVGGTAQSLMDAFIGESRNGKNKGLINQLWKRLFDEEVPKGFLKKAACTLKESNYTKDRFFDLRMGLKLDEDRMASESGKNYKFETIFKNAEFIFKIDVDMDLFKKNGNGVKLICVFNEMQAGRFWYGAGKSKGLGRCSITFDSKFPELPKFPQINSKINHLHLDLSFSAKEPILVGWNWGKIDPVKQDFIDLEGQFLIEGMRMLPDDIKEKLISLHGGDISSLDKWKNEVFKSLPSVIAYTFTNIESKQETKFILPKENVLKLTKGKFPISKKTIEAITNIIGIHYNSREDLEKKFNEVLGEKDSRKNKRILDLIEVSRTSSMSFPDEKYSQLKEIFSLDDNHLCELKEKFPDPDQIAGFFEQHIDRLKSDIHLQVDQQAKLLQSDPWVEDEIEVRYEHIKIKEMLLNGQISEHEWGNFRTVPKGVSAVSWREFLQSHDRIQYHHILNRPNLLKSITNDKNIINFLRSYKIKAHQELSQPMHIDYRGGGDNGRNISKKYGKPYDTIFMRMLSWSSKDNNTRWEVYIPGSTIKGAFRRRTTSVLGALWKNKLKVREMLDALFGAQRKPGLLKFSDAYPSTEDISRKVWCSMDAIQIDPLTGKPTDQAKSDYLYAYGNDLKFNMRIDIQDLCDYDEELIGILLSIIHDFQNGDVPLGGDKTNGMGWIKAIPEKCTWYCSTGDQAIHKKYFSDKSLVKESFWNTIKLNSEEFTDWVDEYRFIKSDLNDIILPVALTNQDFVSHKYFGGYCGEIHVEGHALTPIHVQESGEPIEHKIVLNKRINGWDHFSLSSPENCFRDNKNPYAIPSKTLKGMIRNIYSIASNSDKAGRTLASLNPTEKMFGWVGDGVNQSLMGRVSVGFGLYHECSFDWYSVPNQYGEWENKDNGWVNDAEYIRPTLYSSKWRVFPHTGLAPCITKLGSFEPNNINNTYIRACSKGSSLSFKVKFWNLTKEEFQLLLWSIALDTNSAHKVGKHKHLGFGSLKLRLNKEESYLVNFKAKYAKEQYKEKINFDKYLSEVEVFNRNNINKFFDASFI